ncbi:YraN family protein [Phaeovulum sp. W22_SRMD_FR3]|uniref:YraN family protein n=1 Tax=Phaeovulum sp. W22_SRMD_FR3 TaxID=3240274 RepID=UPI003F94367B
MGGALAYHGGLAAESQVAAHYQRQGRSIAARRWRGGGGEIDLIARDGATVIFIEVKKASSHARAAERLSRRQMDRIYASASAFIGGEPAGQLTEVRFDVALVDGFGKIEILENAFDQG